MDEPDNHGTEDLVDTEAAKPAVQPCYARLVVMIPQQLRSVAESMAVKVAAVVVRVNVERTSAAPA